MKIIIVNIIIKTIWRKICMVKKVVASLFSLINKKRIPSLKNRDDNKYTNDIEYKNCW